MLPFSYYRWVPVSERSRSLSLVYSGMFIGSIMGLALSPAMIASMGWPSVFYIFGSLGVFWYTWWSSRAASTPQDDPTISREEKVGGACVRIWGGDTRLRWVWPCGSIVIFLQWPHMQP